MKKPLKILVWFFSSILLLTLAIVAFLPSILSTELGKQNLLSIFNSKINGKLQVKSIHLSWFGQQSLSELELKDPYGETVISIQDLNSTVTFFDLLRNKFTNSNLEIHSFNINLYETKPGITNLQEAIYPFFSYSSRFLLTEELADITLRDATLKIIFLPNEMFHFLAQGKTIQNNIDGSFDIDAELFKSHSNEMALKRLTAKMDHFPTALLDQFVSIKKPHLSGLIPLLVGNTFNLSTDHQFEKNGTTFSLNINSSKLYAQLTGNTNKEGIQINQPGKIHLKLSPELLPYLHGITKLPWILKNSIDAEMLIHNGMLPFAFLDPSSTGAYPFFNATIALTPAMFESSTSNKEVSLEGISIDLNGNESPIEKVTMNLKGKISEKNFPSIPLNIHTSFEKSTHAHTFFDTIKETLQTIQLDIQSHSLPLGLLCRLSGIQKKMEEKILVLFGKTVEANIHLDIRQLDSQIKATLQSDQGSLHLDGNVSNGILYLNAPFEMTTKVTPELGSVFFSNSLSLLKGMIAGNAPIKIRIDHRKFACPVNKIAPEDVQISQGVIHLGKIIFANEGQLKSISSILDSSNEGMLSIWFTPLYFHMHQGKLIIERMDLLLLDAYPLAIWGNIHFPRDRVNMKIGLSGLALSRSLGISVVDNEGMIQIPFKGSLSKASIDKGAATAKIGALIAQKENSPQGMLIGAVLGIASGSINEEKVPAPTTSPLPWGSMIKEAVPRNEVKKEKNRDKKEKLGKKLKKAASSIVNEILK